MHMAITFFFTTNVIAALHKSPQDFNSTEEMYNATEGLFMDDTYASWFGLSNSEWRDGIKMVGNVAAVRAVPGRSQDNRCRHCHKEVETLAHVQGSYPHGEALRNARHHQVRSIIATALKDADYNTFEVHGLSVTGSTRRIDIIAFKESTRSGFIIDPTVRFETDVVQPAEVDNEKMNIYNTTIPYYLQKYQLKELEVIGLLVGARVSASFKSNLICKICMSVPISGKWNLISNFAGGLPYICQPIGSFASGFLVTWFGRKRSLMLVCVPHVISCVLISTAPSLAVLFLANVIIGITVGLTEAPISSYSGEICQPTLRSVLASCTESCSCAGLVAALFYQFGMFLVLMLGSIMHWRTTAAVCVAAPIITIILISQIPDSPIWLIAQDRKNDAEAALCWLRGWVEPSAVRKELEELLCYHENVTLKSAVYASKSTQLQTLGSPEVLDVIPHHRRRSKWSRSMSMIRLLLEPETLRPLVLTLLFFTFSSMGGMISVKPFLVEVLHRFHSPMDPKWSSVSYAITNRAH
ncbi:hypothetical protein ANN_04473 [Periplaneta americana]|uniref:Major facilitator superfamily (MFS) profile domain-containing protein n=1 Tax=Periplaneta americana TaxID=6978 RepID=A0ABQ8TAK8_PERAM|nr:hypothetical protein ANN_04473 [Periplaneta americana]